VRGLSWLQESWVRGSGFMATLMDDDGRSWELGGMGEGSMHDQAPT